MHSGEKSNKCNICDYASSYKNHLRQHIKSTVQKIQTNATNTTIPFLRHRVWRIIWKCTVEKSQTSATYATLHPLIKAIWGNLGKGTVEKSKTNATNVTMDTLIMAIWGNIQKMHSRERSNATNATMPLLEGTFENAQWRKVKQMQPMWLHLLRHAV